MKTRDVKNKKAVALKYEDFEKAPVVNAKGRGYVAEKILQKAKQEDIPTYYDEELLESLMQLSIGDEIPEQLYDIVAKILQYVDFLEKNTLI